MNKIKNIKQLNTLLSPSRINKGLYVFTGAVENKNKKYQDKKM